MNATTHLMLDELLELVDPATPRPEHLAGCETCRAELRSWTAVAAGAKVGAEAAPPPLPETMLTGPGTWAGRARRHRAELVTAAAVVAVLVGGSVGYGVTRGGPTGPVATPNPRPTTGAAPTDDPLCDSYTMSSGRLTSINGSTLLVSSAKGKQTKASITTATRISRRVTADPSDVVDGAKVEVFGNGDVAGRHLGAERIEVVPDRRIPDPNPLGTEAVARSFVAAGSAVGTVGDRSATQFTVTLPGGWKVNVIVTPATKVNKWVGASAADLVAGYYSVAVGIEQPDGSLRAVVVQQDTLNRGTRATRPFELRRQVLVDPPPPTDAPRTRGCSAEGFADATMDGWND